MALYVPVLSLGFGGLSQVILLSLTFPLLCLSVFGWKVESSRIWTFTPFRWLGNMSYSYYLIHGLVLNAFFVVYGKLGIDLVSWEI